MGRQSHRKQHLKQLNAAKSRAASHLPPTADKESLSSDDEILWSDEELDRHPEVTIKKLFNSAQNIVPSKRPFSYTGNSKRTQRRRRADARQDATKNGRTMLDYFSTAQASPSGTHLSVGECETENGNTATVGEDEDEICAHEETTSELDDQYLAEVASDTSSEDGCLSNEDLISSLEKKRPGTSEKEEWRLRAVLQYLRLLKFEHSRMQASLSVARQLGRDVYLARQIRYWAYLLRNGQDIPASKRGKHVKVKSLLEDEDVQHKILQYLRTSKFEFYVADFVRYVSDDVFPSLGISQRVTIG
jgi:hypothetical protein